MTTTTTDRAMIEAIRVDLIDHAQTFTYSALSDYLSPVWIDGCAQRCHDLIDPAEHKEVILDDQQRVRDALEQQLEYASHPQILGYYAYLTSRLSEDAAADGGDDGWRERYLRGEAVGSQQYDDVTDERN